MLVPIAGALIIGVMARYGSERIRGHGIPEAIEAILINGSVIEPRVAVLKPLSSAISIGSGGPFGAEGPIIMTGRRVGFHDRPALSPDQRRAQDPAGGRRRRRHVGHVRRAGGGGPAGRRAAAVRVEAAQPDSGGAGQRHGGGGRGATSSAWGRCFPVPPHPVFIGPQGLLGCVLVGVLAGALSALLTLAVYAAEDGFRKLPIHWMWWPAIGGLAIGLGGLVFPQALGVGYDTIGALLQGSVTAHIILGVSAGEMVIWAVSLGSGTSGACWPRC